MKKVFSALLIIVILTGVLMLCALGYLQNIHVVIANTSTTMDINFVILMLGLFVSGAVFQALINVFKSNKKTLNSYKNQYEKIAISNEEQTDKVKILEEKIKSLEIALSKALKK